MRPVRARSFLRAAPRRSMWCTPASPPSRRLVIILNATPYESNLTLIRARTLYEKQSRENQKITPATHMTR